MSFGEWLKEKTDKAIEAGQKMTDKIDDGVKATEKKFEEVKEDIKELDLTGKAKEAFKDAAEGAKNAIEHVKEVDWSAVNDKVQGAFKDIGDVSAEGMAQLNSAIESDGMQNFLDGIGDNLPDGLADKVADSVEGMDLDPAALAKTIGATVLSGGANIPIAIAQKVFENPEVQATFSEVLEDALPDDMKDEAEALSKLSNAELLQAIKDPSVSNAVQAALKNPEVKQMIDQKMNELKPQASVEQGMEQSAVVATVQHTGAGLG